MIESLVAGGAAGGPLAPVHSVVRSQCVGLFEGLGAQRAGEGRVARVCALVHPQAVRVGAHLGRVGLAFAMVDCRSRAGPAAKALPQSGQVKGCDRVFSGSWWCSS